MSHSFIQCLRKSVALQLKPTVLCYVSPKSLFSTKAVPSIGILAEESSLPKVMQDVKKYVEFNLSQSIPRIEIVHEDLKGKMVDHSMEGFDRNNIPYVIALTETVLEKGITLVRNRETTLWEEVHLSDLVKYMKECYKPFSVNKESVPNDDPQ